jgi:hypothetical protein
MLSTANVAGARIKNSVWPRSVPPTPGPTNEQRMLETEVTGA